MCVCVSLYVSVPCARTHALVCVCVRACACACACMCRCVCVCVCVCAIVCLCVVLGGFEQIVAAMLKEMQMCASSAIALEQQMQQVSFNLHRFLFIGLFSHMFTALF